MSDKQKQWDTWQTTTRSRLSRRTTRLVRQRETYIGSYSSIDMIRRHVVKDYPVAIWRIEDHNLPSQIVVGA